MAANHLSRTVRPLLTASVNAGRVLTSNYHEKVIDHYENPRNVGSFDKSDANIGTGLVGAPACGDVMKLQVRLVFLCILFFYLLDLFNRLKSMKMEKLLMQNLKHLVVVQL
jgi:hypothetical protein